MISRIFDGNRGSVQYFPAGKCRPGVDLRARERPPKFGCPVSVLGIKINSI